MFLSEKKWLNNNCEFCCDLGTSAGPKQEVATGSGKQQDILKKKINYIYKNLYWRRSVKSDPTVVSDV